MSQSLKLSAMRVACELRSAERICTSARQIRSSSTSTASSEVSEGNMLRALGVFAGGIALYGASQQLVPNSSMFDVSFQRDVKKQIVADTKHSSTDNDSSEPNKQQTTWWRLTRVRDEAKQAAASPVRPWGNRMKATTPANMV